MKLRTLLIAAFILAILSGVLYWSEHRKPADEPAKVDADIAPKIISLDQASITGLAILHKGDPALTLSKDAGGSWQITSPKPLPADQDAVSSVASALSSLNSDRLIEDKAADLASYGLAAPALTLQIATKDGKKQTLFVGDDTPTGNAAYAALAGDPRVFTIAGSSKSSLDKSAKDLRDRRLLTADFDKVHQIELHNQSPGKKLDITLSKDNSSWQILKPAAARAETSKVDELTRSLQDAKLDVDASASDDAKLASSFASAAPFVTAKIIGPFGEQELQIRKAKDDYYAKSSVASGVFKVPATVATGLDKNLDDFRNKKLFDFGFQSPDKIEIHDGEKAYDFMRSNADWWGPDGKKLDLTTVDPLWGKLRELTAEKFPDSGYTAPSIQITVVSNDGKTTERVSIAKSGDSYIAKRENEPALYQLTAASITDIEQAAAAVKPAPPPATPAPTKK